MHIANVVSSFWLFLHSCFVSIDSNKSVKTKYEVVPCKVGPYTTKHGRLGIKTQVISPPDKSKKQKENLFEPPKQWHNRTNTTKIRTYVCRDRRQHRSPPYRLFPL